MDLDAIKAQLDRIFAAGNRPSSRDQAGALREALVSFKVGIGQLQDAVQRSERELQRAEQDAADYTRRGGQAEGIGDQETVRVAQEFAARATERVDLLQRKLIVQRDELAIAEREYLETKQRYQSASRGLPLDVPSNDPPELDAADQALLDQRAREAAVDAQLAHLKKQLGEKR